MEIWCPPLPSMWPLLSFSLEHLESSRPIHRRHGFPMEEGYLTLCNHISKWGSSYKEQLYSNSLSKSPLFNGALFVYRPAKLRRYQWFVPLKSSKKEKKKTLPQLHISFQNSYQWSNGGIIFLFTDKSLSTKRIQAYTLQYLSWDVLLNCYNSCKKCICRQNAKKKLKKQFISKRTPTFFFITDLLHKRLWILFKKIALSRWLSHMFTQVWHECCIFQFAGAYFFTSMQVFMLFSMGIFFNTGAS